MELLTTGSTAQLLEMSNQGVYYHVKQGHLVPMKIERGHGQFQRLFLREDVERFLQRRAEQRARAEAAKASTT
jgi:hypothetical protein